MLLISGILCVRWLKPRALLHAIEPIKTFSQALHAGYVTPHHGSVAVVVLEVACVWSDMENERGVCFQLALHKNKIAIKHVRRTEVVGHWWHVPQQAEWAARLFACMSA